MVLKMSGMDAQIVPNLGNVLEQMREFHPDLILMNTFLSEINAADLARVIRQIDDFVSIPIIFLSSEDDFGKRIEALDLGGDDFLVKPIKASHLMAVVRSRLERSKTLRSYMVRDSLTNLLNHTAFRSVLTQEVNRCKRQKTPPWHWRCWILTISRWSMTRMDMPQAIALSKGCRACCSSGCAKRYCRALRRG